jgi:hypothetical protein
MSLDLRTLVSFFAEFERSMEQIAPPGLMVTYPRDIGVEAGLGKLYSNYSNCKFEVFEGDFSAGLRPGIDLGSAQNESITHYVQPAEIGSLVINFDSRAEVIINSAKNGAGLPILNRCYRRFLFLKEVLHVVLRDEFARKKVVHPDTGNPELLVTLLEQLIYLPFSIIDFDNPEYTDVIKVEHAAELFSALSLYPLEHVNADRKEFLQKLGVDSMEHPLAITTSTLPYAEKYKMPRRYVDLLFRWGRFDELYATYRLFRAGY